VFFYLIEHFYRQCVVLFDCLSNTTLLYLACVSNTVLSYLIEHVLTTVLFYLTVLATTRCFV